MPTNTIVLNDNAALRATLTASTTRSGTAISNLITTRKGDIWGSTASTATITATFAQNETIGMVALPFCNLTSTSTMRVRCYSDTGATVLLNDTSAVSCTPAPVVDYSLWNTVPAGANGFAYGGGSYAVVYTSATVSSVRCVKVDLVHTGTIDAACLVMGSYRELIRNPTLGIEPGNSTLSKATRSGSGDNTIDRGPISKKLKLDFSGVPDSERKVWFEAIRKSSIDFPMFVSVFPGDTDKQLEHQLQIYGYLSALENQKMLFFNNNLQTLAIDEV
jgi:hypothetical protein